MGYSKYGKTPEEKAICNRMKEKVKSQGTQKKAAKRLSMPESTLSRMLNPEDTRSITVDDVCQFGAKFCGGDIVYLLTGEVYIDKQTRDRMFGGFTENEQKFLIERFCSISEDFRKNIWKK